jgi:hypothetical protein
MSELVENSVQVDAAVEGDTVDEGTGNSVGETGSEEDSGDKEPEDGLFQLACDHSERRSGPLRAMMDLPVQRTVELRTGLSTPNMDRMANREAIVAQAVGDVERRSCKHCSKGEGLFTSCVRVKLNGSCILKGSCGGCHANSCGARCSLRLPHGSLHLYIYV